MIIMPLSCPWNVGLTVTEIISSFMLFKNWNESKNHILFSDFSDTLYRIVRNSFSVGCMWSKSFLPFGSYFNIMYVGAMPVVVLPVHVVSYNWNIVGDGRMEGLGETVRCRYGADPYVHTWLWPIPSKGYFNSVVWIITGIRLRPVAVNFTVQLIGIVQTYGVQSAW